MRKAKWSKVRLTVASLVAASMTLPAFGSTPKKWNETNPVTKEITRLTTVKMGIKMKGQIRFDFLSNEDSNGDYVTSLRTKGTDFTFKVQLTEALSAKIQLKADHNLRKDGQDLSPSFNLENAIKALTITYADPFGIDGEIEVGKEEVKFGQDYSKGRAMYHNNPTHKLAEQNEVMGVSVTLNKDISRYLQSIEISLFETGRGDLDVSDDKGVSIRFKGKPMENLKSEISYMHKENDESGGDSEDRVSVGVIYERGEWKAYAELLYLNNVLGMEESDAAVQAGVTRWLGPVEINGELAWVDDYNSDGDIVDLTISAIAHLKTNLSVGAEATHRISENGDNLNMFGVRTSLDLFKDSVKPKRTIFDKKK